MYCRLENGDEIVFKNHATFNNRNFNWDDCPPGVVDPETLSECSNEYYHPQGLPGPLVVKVPVVLSEVKVQVDLETNIRLEEPAFDIKTIDKKVCITQCHLVPYTNKLFLGGYVQKNIQYSTVENPDNGVSVSGAIRHTTLNVPFRCVTAVKFARKPIFGKYDKVKSNVIAENMVCGDTGEDSWMHFNDYYEPIFCEVEWTKILETDIYNRNIETDGNFSNENLFQDFVEKMVVYIRLKVLQTQQVFVPEPECEVYMKKEDEYEDFCEEIEVGYIPGKGLVGKRQKKYDY